MLAAVVKAGRREAVRERVLAHMVERLAATATQETPYPHFWVQQVFPDEIYAEMQERLPADSFFQPQNERFYTTEGVSTRFQLPMCEPQLAKLPGEAAGFWLGIQDALASEALKRAVYRCLAPGLAFRFGVGEAEVEDLPGVPAPRFFRETDGYAIAPHPDTRRKVVTLQFALPKDRSQLDLGTGIYARSLSPADWLGQTSGFRGFKKVGQYPFEPNSAFAFSVLNSLRKKSWHGREKLERQSGTRNSILTIYFARAEDSDLK